MYDSIRDLDAEVLAISTDDLEGAEWVVDRVGIEFPILYDSSENVPKEYGVFNLLGDGLATTSTFIIGKDGRIGFQYVGARISDQPPTERVIDELRRVNEA